MPTSPSQDDFGPEDPAQGTYLSPASQTDLEDPAEPVYRFDSLFERVHNGVDLIQDGVELFVDIFLKVFMSKPVQFTAGALTGVFCLLLMQQLLFFAFSFFVGVE